MGRQITEADRRLLTTLFRFDVVYYSHFKCNRQRLLDYPNLWAYIRALYQMPGVARTLTLDHIEQHYYTSYAGIHPDGIVFKEPVPEFAAFHGRERPG